MSSEGYVNAFSSPKSHSLSGPNALPRRVTFSSEISTLIHSPAVKSPVRMSNNGYEKEPGRVNCHPDSCYANFPRSNTVCCKGALPTASGFNARPTESMESEKANFITKGPQEHGIRVVFDSNPWSVHRPGDREIWTTSNGLGLRPPTPLTEAPNDIKGIWKVDAKPSSATFNVYSNTGDQQIPTGRSLVDPNDVVNMHAGGSFPLSNRMPASMDRNTTVRLDDTRSQVPGVLALPRQANVMTPSGSLPVPSRPGRSGPDPLVPMPLLQPHSHQNYLPTSPTIAPRTYPSQLVPPGFGFGDQAMPMTPPVVTRHSITQNQPMHNTLAGLPSAYVKNMSPVQLTSPQELSAPMNAVPVPRHAKSSSSPKHHAPAGGEVCDRCRKRLVTKQDWVQHATKCGPFRCRRCCNQFVARQGFTQHEAECKRRSQHD